MKTIIADCTVDGYLRYGHYELGLTDEEYADFSKMDESEKEKYILRKGKFTLDDWCVNDVIVDGIREIE